MTTSSDNKLQLPVLPLRDVVVFPHMVIPLFVGRERSISALQHAMDSDKKIFLVAQKKAADDAPSVDDVFDVGCVATILQMMKLPDGNVRLLVEGEHRARSHQFEELDSFLSADIALIGEGLLSEVEEDAMIRTTIETFETLVKLNKKVPSEILNTLTSIDDAGRLADTIIAHLPLKIEEKQKILEMGDVNERMDQLMAVMESELDLLQVEKKIRGRVKKQMEKSQREYYLNEQMKAIQKELGDVDENGNNEIDDLHLKISESGMTEDALEKATAELKKLKMMPPMSSEATVVRGYIEWLVGLPWKKKTKVRKDLAKAEEILEADHYGLEKVKDRILEYLAVQNRVNKLKGPILCLVGPPGVGKTSLARSIARSTGRKFVRMSLGGVRDEAEIRGHRRTYIGSMPGKLVQKISKAKVKNPLVLLDEIDKMAMDMRGDPASALLEVLDPEQNKTFNDHYLEVDYDLSDVMFVATSNSMNIPAPLLDRMEVIRIAGYTEDEKLNIANRYLLPKQIKENGVKKNELAVPDEAILDIIRYYTREAGVRNLERELANICRKAVKKILLKELKPKIDVNSELLVDLLGVKRFDFGQAAKEDQIGQVTGLAWTEVGGDLLSIETAVVPGKGKHSATGRLGDVMQESIKAAMTVVRNRAVALGINPDFYEKNDVHVHVPEGATPKDGPSAGIAMCTALTSVLTGIPVSSQVAMTGEITLRGEVLPIGGLKEKLLAAHRGGIKTVIIPKDNEKDLAEIPDNIKADLTIHPVRWFDEVIKLALVRLPLPLTSTDSTESSVKTEAKVSGVQAH
jgi:ATP-dependent Lon protease